MVKGVIDQVEYKVLWFKGGDLRSVPIELTSVIDHSSQDGIKLENNVVNLQLQLDYIYPISLYGQTTIAHQFVNPFNGKIVFTNKDIVRIFCKYRDGTPIDTTQYGDILQDYVIKNWSIDEQSKILSLSAVDINYKIFNRLWNGVYTTNVKSTYTSVSTNTLTDSTATWTTNQWVNRTLQMEDVTGKQYTYLITSNTATQLTVHRNISGSVTTSYIIGHSSPSAIVNALKQVIPATSYTGAFSMIVEETTDIGSAYQKDVQFLRPDNSAFPVIDFAIAREPYYKLLGELSSINAVNTPWELENNSKLILRDMEFNVGYDTEQKQYRLNWYCLTAPNKLDTGVVSSLTTLSITDNTKSMTTNEYKNKLLRCNNKTYQIISNNSDTFQLGNFIFPNDVTTGMNYTIIGDCEFIWDNEKDFKQIYNSTPNTETEDAVNHIYFTCGTNPLTNRDITGHKLNENSESVDLKDTFIPMKGIMREFMKLDGRFNSTTNEYEYPTFPYVPKWTGAVNTTSEASYNAELKRVCRNKAYLKCEDIFAKTKEGYLKTSFTIRGNRFIKAGDSDTTSKWYATGSRILYKNLRNGIVNVNQPQGYFFLRVKSINHTIKNGTWTTKLDCEYDLYSENEEALDLSL